MHECTGNATNLYAQLIKTLSVTTYRCETWVVIDTEKPWKHEDEKNKLGREENEPRRTWRGGIDKKSCKRG